MRSIFPNDWTALESHPKGVGCFPIQMLDGVIVQVIGRPRFVVREEFDRSATWCHLAVHDGIFMRSDTQSG